MLFKTYRELEKLASEAQQNDSGTQVVPYDELQTLLENAIEMLKQPYEQYNQDVQNSIENNIFQVFKQLARTENPDKTKVLLYVYITYANWKLNQKLIELYEQHRPKESIEKKALEQIKEKLTKANNNHNAMITFYETLLRILNKAIYNTAFPNDIINLIESTVELCITPQVQHALEQMENVDPIIPNLFNSFFLKLENQLSNDKTNEYLKQIKQEYVGAKPLLDRRLGKKLDTYSTVVLSIAVIALSLFFMIHFFSAPVWFIALCFSFFIVGVSQVLTALDKKSNYGFFEKKFHSNEENYENRKKEFNTFQTQIGPVINQPLTI